MKARSFLFIIMSCLLVVGCTKKSEDEPTPTPSEPSYTKITEDMLKSYFPYAVDDQIVFRNEILSVEDNIYTVKECTFTNKAGKMNLAISMNGKQILNEKDQFIMEWNAEVTDNKILKIDFVQYLIVQPSNKTIGTYTYDASKDGELPAKITLSNGAIIQQDKGLTYYEDYDSGKWYFLKRK